jgi:RNA polymerase sigma-70 factor (ECF subfamily)
MTAEQPTREESALAFRPLLFAIAYRMVSVVTDAEDIVQEAYLRYHRAVNDGVQVDSTRAFLSAVTTRLAIDHLRAAKSRRETYIGNWLPEPLLTEHMTPDPATAAEEADSISMAFLLVLERLSPVERAVFLLHDVFDYDFTAIAPIVGKTADNCRQIAVRARRHVHEERPRFRPTREERNRLADQFVEAFASGAVDDLAQMLAADVVVTGDSGGARPSWPRPIVGQAKVVRLLAGLAGDMAGMGLRVERTEVNGEPGALIRDPSGALVNVFSFEIVSGQIQAIRSVINRDKLRHLVPVLGPLAEVDKLARARRS